MVPVDAQEAQDKDHILCILGEHSGEEKDRWSNQGCNANLQFGRHESWVIWGAIMVL